MLKNILCGHSMPLLAVPTNTGERQTSKLRLKPAYHILWLSRPRAILANPILHIMLALPKDFHALIVAVLCNDSQQNLVDLSRTDIDAFIAACLEEGVLALVRHHLQNQDK